MNDLISTIFNWFSSLYSADWDTFLYDQGYYSYFGIIFLVVSILIAAIFYFTPTVKFHGVAKWFIFMLVMAILIFLINMGVSDYWGNNATTDELPEYDFMDNIGTCVIGVIWGIITYFIVSILMSRFSTHNYKIPF